MRTIIRKPERNSFSLMVVPGKHEHAPPTLLRGPERGPVMEEYRKLLDAREAAAPLPHVP